MFAIEMKCSALRYCADCGRIQNLSSYVKRQDTAQLKFSKKHRLLFQKDEKPDIDDCVEAEKMEWNCCKPSLSSSFVDKLRHLCERKAEICDGICYRKYM